MDKKILAFGSSITWGAWDEKGGWTDRLKQFLNNKVIDSDLKNCHMLYNLGISGDSTAEIVKRFENELERRLSENEDLIILFELGINDSQYINAEKEFRVPKEKFKDNLQNLIQLSQKYTQKITFVGPTPVIDNLLDPIPWYQSCTYKTSYIEEFNNILASVCKQYDLPFINFLSSFLQNDYKNLLTIDGVHPNSKGHELIFEKVKEVLTNKGYI